MCMCVKIYIIYIYTYVYIFFFLMEEIRRMWEKPENLSYTTDFTVWSCVTNDLI